MDTPLLAVEVALARQGCQRMVRRPRLVKMIMCFIVTDFFTFLYIVSIHQLVDFSTVIFTLEVFAWTKLTDIFTSLTLSSTAQVICDLAFLNAYSSKIS